MMNEGVPVKTVCFSKQQQQPVLLVSVCSLFFVLKCEIEKCMILFELI